MMLIDGKKYAQEIKNSLKAEVDEIRNTGMRLPKLTVVMVGNNPASNTYVKNKVIACNYIGILSEVKHFSELSEYDLLSLIRSLNKDDTVDGILVQLPLPDNINEETILNAIDPSKDVDGFHPSNIADLFLNEACLQPCTPLGIINLLENTTQIEGKNVVVVGRSNIVGKPIALMCLHKNATVTIAHSKTKNLQELCRNADIVITAIGKPLFFTDDYFTEDTIVIDAGINRDSNGKLCGDVDRTVQNKVKAITPVPGGVGPMTIAVLMQNTLKVYKENIVKQLSIEFTNCINR